MNKNRRSFFTKLIISAAAMLGINNKGNAISKIKNPIDMNTHNDTNPIIKIKPLGFQWETSDPFLFCVHHDDKFPKGNAHQLSGRKIKPYQAVEVNPMK